MDWFGAILAHMPDKDAWAFVLNLVLILVIDRRLLGLLTAMERLNGQVRENGHNVTDAMTEIRRVLYTKKDSPRRVESSQPSPR